MLFYNEGSIDRLSASGVKQFITQYAGVYRGWRFIDYESLRFLFFVCLFFLFFFVFFVFRFLPSRQEDCLSFFISNRALNF